MQVKICKKCHIEKSIEDFGVHSRLKSGISNVCKKCNCEKVKEWSSKNKDKIKNSLKLWREKNKEHISKYNHAYRVNNYELIKKYAVIYRASHKDEKKAKAAAWYKANEKLARQLSANWRKANPEKVKEMNVAWRKANPEAVKLIHQNRRAKKRENGGSLSRGISQRLFLLQRGLCPCCKKPLGKDFELDHIHPIALGGANSDENIQLLRKVCNRRKRAKHPIDYMQEQGFLL